MTGYLLTSGPEHDPGRIATWTDRVGTAGWIILQSYAELRLIPWKQGMVLPPLGEEFSGRVFGERAELRWLREGNSFDLWLLEDCDSRQEGAVLYEIRQPFYYGLGYWRNGRWWEPTIPEAVEPYRALGGGIDGDRPRFLVNEYYRLAPETWPAGIDAFEAEVNLPSLAAYRLAGLDAGKDGK